MRAAIACHPFERSKFAGVASVTAEDLAVRMQQALEARMKVVSARPTEVKELPKPVEPVQVELPDHSKPFAVDNKSRFRRL